MPTRSLDELREENERLESLVADLETRQSEMRELEQRLKLFEAMMSIVPVGMVISDADGRILHGNKQIEEMVRHPVLKSENADEYGEWVSFHEDGRRVESREYPLARVILEDAEYAELDVHYQRGDGSLFWMRIIGKPILDDHGKRIGAAIATVDIDEERSLRRAQNVLIAELNHRVKNAFSVTQAIVNRTLRGAEIAPAISDALNQRLHAYSKAHANLVGKHFGHSPLEGIAHDVLDPIGEKRIFMSGPSVELTTRLALSLSMALYELATNAVKYGALSVREGRVDFVWRIEAGDDGQMLHLDWRERGGPAAHEPERRGFGSFVTGRGLMAETEGKVAARYAPEGFEWSLDMPLPETGDNSSHGE